MEALPQRPTEIVRGLGSDPSRRSGILQWFGVGILDLGRRLPPAPEAPLTVRDRHDPRRDVTIEAGARNGLHLETPGLRFPAGRGAPLGFTALDEQRLRSAGWQSPPAEASEPRWWAELEGPPDVDSVACVIGVALHEVQCVGRAADLEYRPGDAP
ncbi:TY-Chap domain-containing protein [Actinocorallia longicatena]|uniref:TY-Chap N-terminal domain-containing protein n=1 Tax=Actinocorallia longicatena TaxID=111803 RepID=A0ABP6QL31_9ACTN